MLQIWSHDTKLPNSMKDSDAPIVVTNVPVLYFYFYYNKCQAFIFNYTTAITIITAKKSLHLRKNRISRIIT